MEKQYNLRLLTPNDLPQAFHIWNVCFGDPPEFTKWYFDTRVKPGRSLGLFEDGELISDTLMIPYTVRLRGKTDIAPYIVGAATLPEHRRKGHMERVLQAALAHMRSQGAGITFLHPFRYSFYRRLGWGRATNMLEYSLSAERLAALCEAGEFEPVRRGDGEELLAIYQKLAEKADTALIRGARESGFRVEETLMEGGFGLLGDGAYALCHESGGKIDAHELVYGQSADIYPILGAMARLPGARSVSFQLPAWEALPGRFADEEPPRLASYMMMRVVDAERALTGLVFDEGRSGVMTLAITDALCPWNEGVYRVELKNGFSEAKRASGDFDAEMDATTLSMLISGYMSFSQAAQWGLLRINGGNGLPRAAFKRQNGFILEKY